MPYLLSAAITSFIVCFLIAPVIIKFSLEKNLLDIPGRRKIHKKVTPSMGGIAIFSGFILSTLIWVEFEYWGQIKFVLVALFIIFIIGVRDDLIPLKAYLKLIGQILAATLFIVFDVRFASFHGFLGIYEVSFPISFIATMMTVVVITNSFNLIDGLDGLAGSLSLLSLLFFGVWFYNAGDLVFAIVSFSMMGAVLAFLIFNWEPSEIFMGDTGALVIGMLLSVLVIQFINTNSALPADHLFKFQASIGTACCVIIVPLIDTARIIILRLSKRQSPFKPDKSHIHHAIMRLGKSHGQTSMILGVTQILFMVIAIICKEIPDRYFILGFVGLALTLSLFLDRLIRKKLDNANDHDGRKDKIAAG